MALGIPPAQGDAFSPFARSGTIHVLVVSGLQVTLVMGALEALWRRLLGRGSSWAAMGGGLGYCVLVGFTAPVWRGLLMGLAWAGGRGTGWKLPHVVTLHGALLAWLLTHPAAGCDPGFLLSWSALAGLLWGAHPLAGLLGPLAGRFALPLGRVAGPWLATLPLLALFHGGVPLWGVAANLLLLPLVSVLAPACLALVLLPAPWAVAPLAGLLGWVGTILVPAFAHVVPLATGRLWPWLALALGWLLLGRLHAAFRRTRWLCAGLVAASLGLLAAGGTGTAPRAFSLEAMDIGQGDALLLRVPGGDATLVDTGPDPRSARRIARILSRRGVTEPVHLVLTHPHLDHAGGWESLEQLWPMASISRPAMAPERWEAFGPALSRSRALQLKRGRGWRRGEADFSVRWPPGPLCLRDVNMNSVVLRVRWRDREAWLMGDALATQERDLLELGDPGPARPGRILKAGHHGSRSASDPAWARALGPRIALMCAGRDNAFGHPHAEALAALAGAQVLVTGDRLGIRVEARPGGWLVETGDGLAMVLGVADGP
jgi:competence protein ComEC